MLIATTVKLQSRYIYIYMSSASSGQTILFLGINKHINMQEGKEIRPFIY